MNFVAQLHPSLVRISLYVHHDSHYHSPHYPVVPIEGASCIPRQLDYCSCSATTAVGYLAVIRLQRCTAAVIRIEVTPVSELSDSLIPRANRMDDCTPAGFSVLTSMPHRFTPALDERASTPVVPFEPLLVKSKPSKTAPVCSSRSNGPARTLQVRRGAVVRDEDRQSSAPTLHGPATRLPILPLEFADQLEFTVAPVSPSDGPAALDLLPTRDWPSLT